MNEEVVYTGNIPQCPNCKKPTIREEGISMTTCAYYPPRYNEEGINTNPDRNITTTSYYCNGCNKNYTVKGNAISGYNY